MYSFEIMDYLMIKHMNVFRLVGDLCHLLAMLILLYKIFKTKSCTGVSGRSQILLVIVFLLRYLDLFTVYINIYNTTMKVIFIACTVFTVYLIYGKYRETYDQKNDKFCVEFLLVICLILAFFINHELSLFEIAWTFSIYLEAVAIMPQLWLTRKVGCTAYMPHYLVALGFYRALYILNWIFRYLFQGHYDGIAIISGVVQTLIFTTFICFGCKKANAPNVEEIVANGDEESVIAYEKENPLNLNLNDNDRLLLINYINRKPALNSGDTQDELTKVHASK